MSDAVVPVDQGLMRKLLLRVLTDDDGAAFNARNVLVSKLRASGCDLATDISLIQDGYAHRTIRRLTDQLDELIDVSGHALFLEAVYAKCADYSGLLRPGWQAFLKRICRVTDEELCDLMKGRAKPLASMMVALKRQEWKSEEVRSTPDRFDTLVPVEEPSHPKEVEIVATQTGIKRRGGRPPRSETVNLRERIEAVIRESGPNGIRRTMIETMVDAPRRTIIDAIYTLVMSEVIFPTDRTERGRDFTYSHYYFKKYHYEQWEDNREFVAQARIKRITSRMR